MLFEFIVLVIANCIAKERIQLAGVCCRLDAVTFLWTLLEAFPCFVFVFTVLAFTCPRYPLIQLAGATDLLLVSIRTSTKSCGLGQLVGFSCRGQ